MKEITSFLKDIKVDKTKARDMAIVLTVAVLVLILYINLFLKPTLTNLYVTIPKVKGLKINIEKVNSELSREGKLKRRLIDLKEVLKNVRTGLPAEKEVPALLENLSSMARNSKIKIIGIRPGSIGKPSPSKKGPAAPFRAYQEVPILIDARSGYHELGRFINDLENLDRFMEVSDIEIKRYGKNPHKHNVKLKISTYLLLSI